MQPVRELHRRAVVAPDTSVGADAEVRFSLCQAGGHALVRMERNDVVRVSKGEQSPPGNPDPEVSRPTGAGIAAANDFDTAVIACVACRDAGTRVSGAVVHQDDLQPGIGLAHKAAETAVQKRLHVVERDDDAY